MKRRTRPQKASLWSSASLLPELSEQSCPLRESETDLPPPFLFTLLTFSVLAWLLSLALDLEPAGFFALFCWLLAAAPPFAVYLPLFAAG